MTEEVLCNNTRATARLDGKEDSHVFHRQELQLHSLAGVPLVNDHPVGVLHVGTLHPRRFTARDVRLLEQVADRMAVAIDRARLYQAERKRTSS